MTTIDTRQTIVAAADDLIYRRGFAPTSFAAIAEAVGISRGNFYHHFKTKDEILSAVIDARIAATQEQLRSWNDAESEPLARIERFVRLVATNSAQIRDFGCPVGTLTAELAKLDHPCRERARAVFEAYRSWLAEQFRALGHEERADELSLQVIAFSQGVAIVLNSYGDETFVAREIEREMSRLIDVTAPASH